jgi:hypothetical protein
MELFYPKIISILCVKLNWTSHGGGNREIIIH